MSMRTRMNMNMKIKGDKGSSYGKNENERRDEQTRLMDKIIYL